VDRSPDHALTHHRVGMTDLVKRPTRKAAALTEGELRRGLARVARLVGWLSPAAVCMVGLTGWRAAVDPRASPGWQRSTALAAPVYLMPNTSGLNARSSLEDLVGHLRAASGAAPAPDRIQARD
jgi:TDG/mug DNA glycosylase family protein